MIAQTFDFKLSLQQVGFLCGFPWEAVKYGPSVGRSE